MKKKTTKLSVLLFLVFNISFGQTNDFKIGMFGFDYLTIGGLPPTTLNINGNNSSQLNVLSEDGFNIVTRYNPDYWTSPQAMQNLIILADLNGMQILTNTKDWYKANANNPGTAYYSDGTPYLHSTLPGTNIYNSQNGDHPNFDYFFDNIYNQSQYAGTVWGHQICEESAFWNPHNYTNQPPQGGWPPTNFIETEVPLPNVLNAINHFTTKKNQNGISNQKLVIMEANHSKAITSNLIYDGENNDPNNQYTAKHLLDAVPENTVFFEGSYSSFPINWYNQNYSNIFGYGPNTSHYLGTFKSIDFAKSKVRSVHDVLSSSINQTGYADHFHSNQSIKNANWMWFKAYTSIIHGVDGIWFWDLGSSWENGEKPSNWNSDPQRFNRNNFSNLYKNYIAYLARELRYLVNKGFLSTEQSTVLYTKKDEADPNCIVPPASSYIPWFFKKEKRNENYGLRYTIRTNGDEVVMIISNPLNYPVTATLNFDNVGNPIIKNAYGVDVLFETNASVTSSTYKTNRNSNINLSNNTVGLKYYKGFSNGKNLTLSFGPMDVHILKFRSNPSVSYNNGWERVWSNYGSGKINGWTIREYDKFYSGDFDGDGAEELLCVQTGTNNKWMAILDYYNGDWHWKWSNYGNNHMMLPYRDNFIVDDFDGDGKDEILGNDIDGWTTMFSFYNNSWHWKWSDYGNHAIRPYKDNLVAGDFDGDGKDEILGCDLPNGWTTMFNFENNNFVWGWSDYGSNHPIRPYRNNLRVGDFDGDGKDEVLGFHTWATLFHFDNNNFQWGWSTYGSNSFGGWTYPIPSNDQVLIGDIDTYDSKDEILFIQTGVSASWATSMDLKQNQSDWNWNWSANNSYSVPYINDWSIADNGGSNTKYILIKVDANQPKYLMALRKFGCSGSNYNYLVSMYKSSIGNNKSVSTDKGNNRVIMITEKATDRDENNWSIYPNPSNAIFNVQFNNIDDNSMLEVYNQTGKLIKTFNNLSNLLQIDLSIYPNGLYLIVLKNSNGIQTKKIQKIK